MKNFKSALIAVATIAGLAFIGAPAAQAAPYPGSVPTEANSTFRPSYYVQQGGNVYSRVNVRSTFGNAAPQGRWVVIWRGNTGKVYRAVKYSTGGVTAVGPVKPIRGTYSVTSYYFPTKNSVYQRSTAYHKQVITRSR